MSTNGQGIAAQQKGLQKGLHDIIENKRERGWLFEPPAPGNLDGVVDFGSLDTLDLSTSRVLSKAFLEELNQHPSFILGARAVRLSEGTTDYLVKLEDDIARYHHAEAALMFHTGYDANVAIYSGIPQQGDIILADEYVHSSIREGIFHGRGTSVYFAHNDVADMGRKLQEIKSQNPQIEAGQKLLFLAVESFYSMDGDVVPLEAMITEFKSHLPHGNHVVVIDEAHSSGLLGPGGSGLVNQLGLDKEVDIRMHSYGKAHGTSGGKSSAVLGSKLCKQALINSVRSVIFSTAPTFVLLASIKVSYDILGSEEGEQRRKRLRDNTELMYKTLKSHPKWNKCVQRGIVSTLELSDQDVIKSPVVPIITQPGDAVKLADHITDCKFRVLVVHFPVVPKNRERIRVSVHADHTKEDIQRFSDTVMEWAQSRLQQDSLEEATS